MILLTLLNVEFSVECLTSKVTITVYHFVQKCKILIWWNCPGADGRLLFELTL